ncbi:MAG: MFS transporter [Jatrophihabitans sp.]
MSTVRDRSGASRPAAGVSPFHLLWFGEGVSVLGNATTSVLIPLLAVVRFQAGPAWLGMLTAAAWLPWLVIGLPAGAWADRLAPRVVMIAADLVSAAVLFSVPIAWWLGVLGLPQLLLVAFLGGIATVFFRTGYVSLLPTMVADHQLETANARLFGTESAMQVAGPGLAGVISQTLSAAGGLVLDAASFLVSAACLWRIRPATALDQRSRRIEAAERTAGLLGQIREGVRLVAGDRHLRALTISGGIANFGLTGYGSLLVLFLVRNLQLSPATVGVVLMLGSCGGLTGAGVATVLARRFGTGRASTVLLLIGGPAALLIGLPTGARQAYLVVAGLVLVGAAVVAGNVIRAAWRQRYVPRALMGRVVATSQVLNYGTMPVAGLVAGWLGGHVGVRSTIIVMAGIHALACWAILLTPLGAARTLPDRRPAAAGSGQPRQAGDRGVV